MAGQQNLAEAHPLAGQSDSPDFWETYLAENPDVLHRLLADVYQATFGVDRPARTPLHRPSRTAPGELLAWLSLGSKVAAPPGALPARSHRRAGGEEMARRELNPCMYCANTIQGWISLTSTRCASSSPSTDLQSRQGRAIRDREEDLAPHAGVRPVRDLKVAVVARLPPDRDQVARHVQAALTAEHHVVERRTLRRAPAHPAQDDVLDAVALQHIFSNVRWHQAEAFEFQFCCHHLKLRRKARRWILKP